MAQHDNETFTLLNHDKVMVTGNSGTLGSTGGKSSSLRDILKPSSAEEAMMLKKLNPEQRKVLEIHRI